MAVVRTTLALACSLAVARADAGAGPMDAFSRMLDKCGDESDLYSCLKLRTVALLDRALAVDTLPVTEYLTIARDPKAASSRLPVKTEGELEASLPRDQHKRSVVLDQMLEDRVARYLDTRTIQLSMPADVLEAGRKKKDKGGMFMMAAAAMGGMMLQMAMGKIALIAGKALLIAKVALLLSAIIGIKKLVGSGGGESHPQVVYAPSADHHGGWGRSLGVAPTGAAVTEAEVAHDIAYQAYRPQT